MTMVRYASGENRAIVTSSGIVLLGADLPAALITRIWEQVGSGRGLAAVLEALTGAFGTSLTAIPPFVVALAEDTAVRIVVRGALTITALTQSDSETMTGSGVTTWTERLISGATQITIAAGEATSPPGLPIRDGVVLASVVQWDVDPAVASTPAPATAAASSDDTRAQTVAPAGVGAEPPVEDSSDAESPVTSNPVHPDPHHDDALASVGAESEPAALIDSVPSVTSTHGETLLPADSTYVPDRDADEREPEVSVTAGPEPLWDATVARSSDDPVKVAGAERDGTVHSGSSEPSPSVALDTGEPVAVGDHDGETISVAQAQAMRSGGDAAVESDSAPPPLAPPRPPAPGHIRLSTGQVLRLDRTVVVGRRPRSTRVTGTDLPHLVAVDSPQQDISRSHVEFRVEGDSILVTDLNTTNGTILRRTGVEPVRLHPGEPTVVVSGDIIDLGDDITIAVDESP